MKKVRREEFCEDPVACCAAKKEREAKESRKKKEANSVALFSGNDELRLVDVAYLLVH